MNKPNILLIMTDQQQAQTISSDHICKTPNIQKLIEKGTIFKKAYTPCAVCTPARASLYSSSYPHKHGMLTVEHSRPAITLLKHEPMRYFTNLLSDNGYHCTHVGRWHITGDDPSPAYDECYTIEDLMNERKKAGLGDFFSLDSIKDTVNLKRDGWKDWLASGTIKDEEKYNLTGGLSMVACEKLEKLTKNNKPWMLTLGLYDPHDPYSCPEEFEKLYDSDTIPKPENWDDDFSDKPNLYAKQRRLLWDKLSWPEQAKCLARYYGSCSYIDHWVGKILNTLKKTGQMDNTMIIYTADHGDMMAGHGLFLKGILPFEEAWKIPLVIKWPKTDAQTKTTCSDYVSLLDVGPTILKTCGVNCWPDSQGDPIQDVLSGKLERNSFYGEFHGGEYYFTQRVVWNGKYKYVFNAFDEDELYDHNTDPNEMRNVINDPDYSEIKTECLEVFWKHHDLSDDFLDISYPNVAMLEKGPLVHRK